MAKAILVLGESGSGKSYSMKNLDPKKTVVFSVLSKGIPIKGSRVNYTIWNKDKNPQGNIVLTSSSHLIGLWLKNISEKRPEITTVVIDDSTFLAAKELDRRRDEVGYVKFSDIAHDYLQLSEIANTLRDDLNIYFMHHVKTTGDGILEDKVIKAMSYGKMIDEKLCSIEAQFEIVLLATKITDENNKTKHVFKTNDPNSTVKTSGLFETDTIPNDLVLVNDAISKFYDEV